MADHAEDDVNDDGDIFVYRGGHVPLHITHVLIDKSVNEIEDNAFNSCQDLLTVDTHDGIRRVGWCAFQYCRSLRRINLKSVVEFYSFAFNGCFNLESVEFGDSVESIANSAFRCTSLSHLKLPSIITIGSGAFCYCKSLIDVEFSDRLQRIEARAFDHCERLQRIAIPLKRNLFAFDNRRHEYAQFDECEQLTTVCLVGEAHTLTVASLHMESWRVEMNDSINRINEILPNTPANEKTGEIRQWMETVLDKMDHYKAEHHRHVKEGTILLELALWKAKLGEKEDNSVEEKPQKAKVDAQSARKGKRITCGADTVIKNVLPFLQLE